MLMFVQIFCASNGGIVVPVKSSGFLDFIQAWVPRSGKKFCLTQGYHIYIYI